MAKGIVDLLLFVIFFQFSFEKGMLGNQIQDAVSLANLIF